MRWLRDLSDMELVGPMHEDPQIPNFGPPGRGAKLKPGMVFAIEPMIWKEDRDLLDEEILLDDGWTVVTPRGQKSAHVEDMVLVTENGPKCSQSHWSTQID